LTTQETEKIREPPRSKGQSRKNSKSSQKRTQQICPTTAAA
jgi:hypothetical protein